MYGISVGIHVLSFLASCNAMLVLYGKCDYLFVVLIIVDFVFLNECNVLQK